MKKALTALAVLLIITALVSCAKSDGTAQTEQATSQKITTDTQEDKDMNKITVTAGGKIFEATLYDNETAREFAARLPLTLDMSELHSNEKYFYLDTPLKASPSVPDRINAGDIRLYGNDCIVLFYEGFKTSYSYTDIGKIDNPEGLGEALGQGDITVSFEIKK